MVFGHFVVVIFSDHSRLYKRATLIRFTLHIFTADMQLDTDSRSAQSKVYTRAKRPAGKRVSIHTARPTLLLRGCFSDFRGSIIAHRTQCPEIFFPESKFGEDDLLKIRAAVMGLRCVVCERHSNGW